MIEENELSDEQKGKENSHVDQSENLSFPNQENDKKSENPMKIDWKEFEVSIYDIKQQNNLPELFDVNKIEIDIAEIIVKKRYVFKWITGNETQVLSAERLENPFYLCKGFFSF